MTKPVDLFTKDWGSGAPLLFVHSWAVDNEVFQYQHAHFAEAGHRVVAYDRRGHGRSAQPGDGYDADTLADDLARVIKQHDLTGVTLVGHSMGGGEIVRYLARHGAGKVARIVLVAPTTPFPPLPLTGERTAALIPRAKLTVYEGAPHGLMFTHAERLNADIAAFIAGT